MVACPGSLAAACCSDALRAEVAHAPRDSSERFKCTARFEALDEHFFARIINVDHEHAAVPALGERCRLGVSSRSAGAIVIGCHGSQLRRPPRFPPQFLSDLHNEVLARRTPRSVCAVRIPQTHTRYLCHCSCHSPFCFWV